MPVLDSTSESQAVYIEQVRQFRRGGKQPMWRSAANRDEKLKAGEINRAVERSAFGYQGGASASTRSLAAIPITRPTCDRCHTRIRRGVRPYRSVYTASGREDCYRCPQCSGRA